MLNKRRIALSSFWPPRYWSPLFLLILVVGMGSPLWSQSAITTSINVMQASSFLEDYSLPGRTIVTVLSTDERPVYEVRMEVSITAGNQTLVFNRNGEAGTLSLFNNVPLVLQGMDLANVINANALEPAQREAFLNAGNQLSSGAATICVAFYDPRFPGSPPVSNTACALAYIQLNQPPLLIDQPSGGVQVSVPQLLRFQWIPQHFFAGATYTLSIWSTEFIGFGENYIINNVAPLIQDSTLATELTIGDQYVLLPPEREYLWLVKARDLSGRERFINNGRSALGRFYYTDRYAVQCYTPTRINGLGGDGLTPLTIAWDAESAAALVDHRISVSNQDGQTINTFDVPAGTYGIPGGNTNLFRVDRLLANVDTMSGPLTIEICARCLDGSGETCGSITYGTVLDDSLPADPCPEPTDLTWTLVDEGEIFASWTPGDPARPHTATLINLNDPPQQATAMQDVMRMATDDSPVTGDNPPPPSPPVVIPPNEMTFTGLDGGDDYRIRVCAPCPEAPFKACTDLYFTMPDLADCNPYILADLGVVTPTTASLSWSNDPEWTDRVSITIEGDSVMLGSQVSEYTLEGLAEGTNYLAEICAYCPGTASRRNCATIPFTTTVFRCATADDLEQYLSVSAIAGGGLRLDWSALPAEVTVDPALLSVLDFATSEVLLNHTATQGQTSHDFTGLETGTNYRVRFCLDCDDDGGEAPLCYETELETPSCESLAVTGLNAADIGSNDAELFWTAPEQFSVDEYRIRYRDNLPDAEFGPTATTNETSFLLTGLLPTSNYLVEVCFDCGPEAESCATLEMTTETINCSEAQSVPYEYVCGDDSDVADFGTVPLVAQLSPGDSVLAGDFMVSISSIDNSASPWRGTGRIMVPYLNEALIKVTFSAIEVNANCRMVSGEMKVVSPWQELLNTAGDIVGDAMDVLNQIDNVLTQISTILDQITDFAEQAAEVLSLLENLQESASIPYLPEDAQQQLQNAINCLTDAIAEGTDPEACRQQIEEALEYYQQALDELYDADFQVPFYPSEATVYGYDTLTYEAMDINGWYPSIPAINGKAYNVAWQSMPSGEAEAILAVRRPEGSLDGVTFISPDSTEVGSPTNEGNGKRLTTNVNETPVIYAIQNTQNDAGEEVNKIAGQLALVSYDTKELNVRFVRVNDADPGFALDGPEVREELERIFRPAIVNVSVTADPQPLEVPGVGIIPDIPSGVFSYPQALRRIINEYDDQRGRDDDTYYIYLVGAYDGDRTGFMPRKRKDGFLFLQNISQAANPEGLTPAVKLARMAGHELGHGAYHLKHTFQETELGEGATDNLMDYAAGGRLHKWQWDLIDDPVSVAGLFEGDDDGSGEDVAALTGFIDLDFVAGFATLEEFALPTRETYLTPVGEMFTLPEGATPYVMTCEYPPLRLPEGSLIGYTYNGKYHTSLYRTADKKFIGYAQLYPAGAQPPFSPDYELSLDAIEDENGEVNIHTFKIDDPEAPYYTTSIRKYYFKSSPRAVHNGSANDAIGGISIPDLLDIPDNLFEVAGSQQPYDGRCGYPGSSGGNSKVVRTYCDEIPANGSYSPDDVSRIRAAFLDAISTRNGRTNSIRVKSHFDHIVTTSTTDGIMLEDREREVMEEQLFLLSEKTSTACFVVFHSTTDGYLASNMAEELLAEVVDDHSLQSNTVYILVPYTYIGNQEYCGRPVYRVKGDVTVGEIDLNNPSQGGTAGDFIKNVFSQIQKPLYSLNVLVLADGSIFNYLIEKDDVQGLPFINQLNFYESIQIDVIKSFTNCGQYLPDEGDDDVYGRTIQYFDCLSGNELLKDVAFENERNAVDQLFAATGLEAKFNLLGGTDWKHWAHKVNVRPGYIEDQRIVTTYSDFQNMVNYSPFLANLGYLTGQYYEGAGDYDSELHGYTNIDWFSVVDPVLYGAGDILGFIPLVGDVTDGLLFFYASVIRQDAFNSAMYGAAFFALGGLSNIAVQGAKRWVVVAKYSDEGVNGIKYEVKSLDEVSDVLDIRYSTLARSKSEAEEIFRLNDDELLHRWAQDEVYRSTELGLPKSNQAEIILGKQISLDIAQYAPRIAADPAGKLTTRLRDILTEMPNQANRRKFLTQLDELDNIGKYNDFLDDLASATDDALVNFFRGPPPGRVNAWRDMATIGKSIPGGGKVGHALKRDAEFLQKYIDELNDVQRVKLRGYLDEQKNFAGHKGEVNYTGTRTIDIGDGIERVYTVQYGRTGFPELEEFCPQGFNARSSDLQDFFSPGKTNLDGGSNDFTAANNWIVDKFPNKDITKNSTGFTLTENGVSVEYTWHHHENGIDIFPVPRAIHNTGTIVNGVPYQGFPHSGGASLIDEDPVIRGFFADPNF